MNTTTLFPTVTFNGLVWELRHPNATPEHLGMLPMWFSAADQRDAFTQADTGYLNTAGCNYRPQPGFKLGKNGENYTLIYGNPEEEDADPPMEELARMKLVNQTIVVFDCEWVAIIQPDETFVVARCD